MSKKLIEEANAKRLSNSNQYEEAIAAFNQAIDLDPNDAVAYLYKGYVLRDLERYDEALTVFNQAIDRDPKVAVFKTLGRGFYPHGISAHLGKGLVLRDLKRDEEASVALDQAARLSPNNGLVSGYAYLLKGKALLALKRYEEAAATFEQVLRIGKSMATLASGNGEYAFHVFGLEDEVCKGKEEARLALKNNEEGHGSF